MTVKFLDEAFDASGLAHDATERHAYEMSLVGLSRPGFLFLSRHVLARLAAERGTPGRAVLDAIDALPSPVADGAHEIVRLLDELDTSFWVQQPGALFLDDFLADLARRGITHVSFDE